MNGSIIFHHYPASPFSEKVRILFGLKRLSWRSVTQPTIMPKPDLVALTGGYRRIPVLQIGADIYCDTAVIMAELENRFPAPKVVHDTDWMINAWADRLLFQTTVTLIFGTIGEHVPAAFIKDREALSGTSFDIARMKDAVPEAKGQFRAMVRPIEHALSSGRAWLGGASPSLADIACYMNIWFCRNTLAGAADALMADMPALAAWRGRMDAIGHGNSSALSPDEAIAVARTAEPGPWDQVPHDDRDSLGLARGCPVAVMANDYGRDPMRGDLLAANAERIIIARDDPRAGRVHIHVPRAGFSLVGS